MDLLTPAQVAEILQVKHRTVLKWLNEKRIPGIKLGAGPKAEWRIEREDLENYIKSLKEE